MKSVFSTGEARLDNRIYDRALVKKGANVYADFCDVKLGPIIKNKFTLKITSKKNHLTDETRIISEFLNFILGTSLNGHSL